MKYFLGAKVVTIFVYYFIPSSWHLSEVGSVMIST